MARMLGRFESPGCCPGRRSGWTRNRWLFGPDCSGGFTDPRHFKRVEQRAFRVEADAWFRAAAEYILASDPSDCAHGCNGECEQHGSEVCTFLCHPTDDAVLATQWAERTGHTTPAGDPDPGVLAAYFEHVERMRASLADNKRGAVQRPR